MSNENELKAVNENNSLDSAADILYLNADNSVFVESGDFVGLRLSESAAAHLAAKAAEDFIAAEENPPAADDFLYFSRVSFHRAFPFAAPNSYVSVFDTEMKEIGIIKELDELDAEQKKLVKREIERKYYAPRINKIYSISERQGFSIWKIDTEAGVLELTLRDNFKSIIHAGGDRIFIADNIGNRYEIESLSALDRASVKKIEIYL
jgi:hypothetical protein